MTGLPPPAVPPDARCGNKSVVWTCNAAKGHEGDHVSYNHLDHPCYAWPQASCDSGTSRRNGKRSASLDAIHAAIGRGQVVHVLARSGWACTRPGHCDRPEWDGELG